MHIDDERGPLIETLRHLLDELGSPDLTLAEGRILRQRVHDLWEGIGEFPGVMGQGVEGGSGGRPDRPPRPLGLPPSSRHRRATRHAMIIPSCFRSLVREHPDCVLRPPSVPGRSSLNCSVCRLATRVPSVRVR
jgi:hypothetical protein